MFHALTEAHLKKIVEIQLDRLRKRLAERKITLELTDAAKAHLVKVGYDPAYGARPLKRTIQKEIETPLARMLLKGDIPDGGDGDGGLRRRTRRAEFRRDARRRGVIGWRRTPTPPAVKGPRAGSFALSRV